MNILESQALRPPNMSSYSFTFQLPGTETGSVLAGDFVNLIQARVIREEGIINEKMPPPDWPADMSLGSY